MQTIIDMSCNMNWKCKKKCYLVIYIIKRQYCLMVLMVDQERLLLSLQKHFRFRHEYMMTI